MSDKPLKTSNKRLLKSVAVSDAEFQGNTLVCWPSVTGVLDLYDDVIFPGAFAKVLAAFLKRGFVPTDHKWEWTSLVAYPTVAEERGNKLYSECVFHSDQASQDALTKCKERLQAKMQVGQSIGFSMMPGQYIYFNSGKELLAYAKTKGYDLALFDTKTITAHTGTCCAIIEIEDLWEYSLTPSPANQAAMAIAVKSAPGVALGARSFKTQSTKTQVSRSAGWSRVTRGTNMKLNTICGAASLPLADIDTPWVAKDALARLREFAGASTEPNTEYAKGFILVDGPNDEFDSYQLPFCDVVDGALTAIPKALMKAANVLAGQTGSPLDLAEPVEISAKTFVETYYAKMTDGASVPWASEETRWKGQYLGEYVEYSMTMAALQQAWYSLQYEVADCIEGWGDYDGMSNADQDTALEGMFDEHKQLCLAMIKAIRDGRGEETAEQTTLSIRRQTVAQLFSLGDGLTYTKHARVTVDATRELILRTKARMEMRLKDGRALSEANRQTLKDHRDALTECIKTIDDLLAQTEPKASAEKARQLRLAFARLQANIPAAA